MRLDDTAHFFLPFGPGHAVTCFRQHRISRGGGDGFLGMQKPDGSV